MQTSLYSPKRTTRSLQRTTMYRNDLIRAKIVNMGLNKSTFAEKSGLGINTARKLWDGATNIELTSLEKASEYLNIPLYRLFTEEQLQEVQIS